MPNPDSKPFSFDLPEFRDAYINDLKALGYPPLLCERLASRALAALRCAYGGKRVWIRSLANVEAARRQDEALTHKGTVSAIVKATGYSLGHVYRLLRNARKMKGRQGWGPGERVPIDEPHRG